MGRSKKIKTNNKIMKIEETLENLTADQLKTLLPCQSAATELLIKRLIAERE